MACNNNQFILSKNIDNEFKLVIKQTGSTLAMEIADTDTFDATLIELASSNVAMSTSDGSITCEVTAPLSGEVTLIFDKSIVADLASEAGEKVDRYYLKPTYKLLIACDTDRNGKFTAKVPEVYVEN